MLDASMFDFDNMKAESGADPFAAPKRQWETDDRFYKLPKDEDGNGQAVIRFLPDSEKGLIQQVFKINTSITKNGKRRFVNELSPQTIGKPCPFQEEWARLWNSGDKDAARTFSRTTRYYTNIKVLKDPRQPENEGKIFLLDMSGSMKDKIQALIDPSEQDRALGSEPKQLFNPMLGNSFKLVSSKGSNGIITYDRSEVINEVNGIYDTVEEALDDIKTNAYKLSDFLKEDAYMSYDELKEKLNYVTFAEFNQAPATAQVQTDSLVNSATEATNVAQQQQPEVHEPAQVQTQVQTQAVQETPATPATQTQEPKKADDLDSLLAGLI